MTYTVTITDVHGRGPAWLCSPTANKGATTTAVRRYLGRIERNGYPPPTTPIIRITNYEHTDTWDYEAGTWMPTNQARLL